MNKNFIYPFLSELLLIIGAIFIGSSLRIVAISFWGTLSVGAVFILGAALIKSGFF